ncbi:MAG TPA: 23S rRNA (guanosine(2251)-2'-O)-methyltransferase RlmB [Balneolales bacterium]|nr:23S rRNA (guanosine(2251)-2'-O)-methyltransferase RlmB [Balneolales bacterium]
MNDTELYIFGRHPVEEALLRNPAKINKIFIREYINAQSIKNIQRLSSENRIPVVHVPGRKLYELVGKVNDQGVVAQMSPVAYYDLDEWLIEKCNIDEQPTLLLLDEIEDPHNLGAILRTVAASGIDAVILPKHRQAPVNATVFKTSAGTAGLVPIIRVTNLNQTILQLKGVGFWIVGMDQNAPKSYWEQDYDMALAVVIGSEGKGIRKKTLEHCDFLINIPMANEVESLNASVSAALVCYEIKRFKSKND